MPHTQLSDYLIIPVMADDRRENQFVRIRGVFGETDHPDFFIHSLGIGQRTQKSVDGHTIDVGEIVFSAQVDFDRFAFLEEVVLKTGFAAFVDRTFSFGNQSLEAKRLRDPEKFIFGAAESSSKDGCRDLRGGGSR